MQLIPYLSRKTLSERHRLSHQQIDEILKEKNSEEHLSEKLELMLQVKEFMQLTDLFREVNVNFIPLKGPLLSYRLYNDSSFRYSVDLDFLIPIDYIKKAIEILEKRGYKPDSFYWPEKTKEQRELMVINNQILFIHPNKNIHVELHWKLIKYKIANPVILSEILQSNRTQINFNGRTFHGFSNEFELLYLIIHGGLHAWKRLKWLLDVKDFIENIPIDADKFLQLTTKLNAPRMVFLCNTMLIKYFPKSTLLPCKPIDYNNSIVNYSISQIESEHYIDSTLESIKLSWFRLKCFPGFDYKLSLVKTKFGILKNKLFLSTK